MWPNVHDDPLPYMFLFKNPFPSPSCNVKTLYPVHNLIIQSSALLCQRLALIKPGPALVQFLELILLNGRDRGDGNGWERGRGRHS